MPNETNLICPACGYDGRLTAHGRYHQTYYPKYDRWESQRCDQPENYTCTRCDYYGTAEEFEPLSDQKWFESVSPALIKRIRDTE